MGVSDVKDGDRRGVLEALRDRLASEVDGCDDGRILPALVLRLTDVLQQLDELPTTQFASRADEIAERRVARRQSGSAHSARA